ncbi:zinc finger MIZ domain-containing protein 1-like isoform X2 [Oscarella lobularis]|uniref:zinc finger MIZ domain-containing protein 1-like isoform X2 n=1 Tax=Oscarella lobularis TaxID=121494 RepID=UPI003313BBE7
MQHPPVISAAAGNVAVPGPGGVPTMEQHIQQTNERLQCIHQYLETQAMFASSAKELLEWCRDERAFQKPFEQGLMACLTVIHKVAGQPGYDLNLAYRLMAVCASHRNKLTPKFSSLLSSWFDDLSRLQFMRQQQGGDIMQADRVPPPQPLISDSTIPLQELSHTPRPSTVNWQGNHIPPPPPSQPPPPPQGAGPHNSQSLSIVTTVWGGVSATQQQQQQQQQQGAPLPLSTTTTSTSAVSSAQMSAQPQQTGATVRYAPPPPPPPLPPPPSSDNPMYQGGFAPGNTRGNGLPPPPPPPPDGTGQASGGPAAAAAAAAVAAAAATATATATAHATARIQQQEEERRRLAHQAHVSGHGQQPGSYPGPAAYFPKQYPGQGMEQGIYPRPPPTGQPRPNQPMYAQHPTWQQQQQQAQQSQVPPPPPQQQADQQHRQQGMRSFPAPFNRPQQLTFGYSDQQPLHQQPSPHGYGPPPGQGMGQSSVFPQMAGTPEGIPPGFPDPNRLPPQQFIERQKRPYASGPGQYGYGPPPPPPPPQPDAQQMGLPGQPPSYIATAQSPQFVKPPSYPSPFMTQGPPAAPRRPSLPPYPGPGGARAPIGQEPMVGTSTAPYGSSVYNPPPADQSGMINRQPPPPPPPPPPPSGGPEIKPEPETKPETLRLSFPVRDGAVLNPFRLQHNLSVSNHAFFLKDQVYGTLDSRSDLELQFKCYHHEDKLVQTNWPAAVSVSVNTHPVHIERGDGRSAHKPLYIKNLCQAGRNTIQISVTACCCSHLFVLQLVHRPSINSVLQSLIKKRLLAVDLCIQKIRANFAATNQLGNQTGVEQTSIKVSLKCPLSFRRITFPARGRECRHVQCFDLESYLQLNCERGTWKCPVCSKPVSLEYIEVDQFIWGILTTIGNNDVDEVMIDPDCHWKPVTPLANVKSEPDDAGVSFAKMRKLDDDSNVAGFRFPDRRPHGSGAGLPMLSASAAASTGQHPPSSADYNHPHYQTSAESTSQQMQHQPPPPPPPERFPPPYQRTYSPRAAQQQLQQQQQPGPPPMLPHQPSLQQQQQQSQAPPPSLPSGPNFQPLMPPFSAKKVDQSGSGTRSGPGTPLGPGGVGGSGQQLPAQSVGSVPTTSTLADGERIGNPGTPLVDIDPSTFCTGGPGSNAPPSNISVTANVLSVRNFPSADDGGIDLLDGSEDLLGDLGDLGDLADDSEIFKIFDSAP